jgi:type II secretory pathway component HofQ
MRFFTAALPFAALLLSPIAASAQTPPPTPQKIVSLDAKTADLHSLAVMLERHAGIKTRIADGDSPYRPISGHFVNVPLRTAIEGIAASAGAKVTQDTAGVYVFTPNASLLNAYSQQLQSQQVQLKTFFAGLPPNQTLTVDLSHPDQALLQMYEAGAVFSPTSHIMASPNAPAAISLGWRTLSERRSLSIQLISTSTVVAPLLLHVTPRVNSDHSVTLNLSFDQSPASKAAAPDVPVIIPRVASRTAASGSMTVFDVTGAFPSAYRVFLFVTPTLVSAGANDGTMNSKP